MLLNVKGLQFAAFQLFDVCADLVDLVRDVDALRAVGHAGLAADAAVCLTKLRNRSVITYKICPARFLVSFVLC